MSPELERRHRQRDITREKLATAERVGDEEKAALMHLTLESLERSINALEAEPVERPLRRGRRQEG